MSFSKHNWNSLFQTIDEDSTTTSYEYVEYNTDDSVISDKTNFQIQHKNVDSYIDYSNQLLAVHVNVKNAAGTANLASTVRVALVNNAVNLFKTIEYEIDNVVVERHNYAGVANSIINYATFSDDYAKSNATSSFLWYPDTWDAYNATADPNNTGSANIIQYNTSTVDSTANGGADGVTALIGNNVLYNKGFHSRQVISLSTFGVYVMIPLKHVFGCCNTNQPMRGVKHVIRLERNTNANCLHVNQQEADLGSVVFNKISLFMPIVRPNIETITNIEASINAGVPMKYNYEGINVYRSQSSTDPNLVWRVSNLASRPIRIFLACQLQAREGSALYTNQVFDNMNLQNIQVVINGKQFKQTPYNIDFGTGDIMRPLLDLQALKGHNKGDGTLINAANYSTLFPIYHFDLTNSDDSIFESAASDVEVRLTLRNTPGSPYVVYCVIQSDNSFEVMGNTQNGFRLTKT